MDKENKNQQKIKNRNGIKNWEKKKNKVKGGIKSKTVRKWKI